MDRDANELTPAYVTLDTYMTMGAFNFVPESLAVNLNCRISQEHRKLLRGIGRRQAGAGRFQGPVSWRSIVRSDSELRRRWRRREESGYDDADLFITPTLSTFGLDMAWYSVTYLLYIIYNIKELSSHAPFWEWVHFLPLEACRFSFLASILSLARFHPLSVLAFLCSTTETDATGVSIVVCLAA